MPTDGERPVKKESDEPKRENGRLKIELPFDDALKAALEIQPKKRKPTKAKRPKTP
jgi:hypothetical protein